MTKYIYLFYILLGVCLLAGFGSAFDSGQEHDVVRRILKEHKVRKEKEVAVPPIPTL